VRVAAQAEPGAPPEQVTVVQEIGEGGEGGQDSSIKKIAQAYAKVCACANGRGEVGGGARRGARGDAAANDTIRAAAD
jgi:hypothetical protein